MSVSVTAEEIVRSCARAWAVQDLEGTLAYMSEDCVYNLHLPPDLFAFAGRHEGKSAVRRALGGILESFTVIAFALDWVQVRDDAVHSQSVYFFRHKASGQELDGRFRLVWRICDGLIVHIDEYHDVARLRAFIDMIGKQGTT